MSVVIQSAKKELDIAFVSEHCCIRVVKEAVALRNLGHRVHVLTAEPNSYGVFSSVQVYKSPNQLETMALQIAPTIDIWQVHNEPTWPVLLLREVLPKEAKILLDAHDTNHWRIEDTVTLEALTETVKWPVFDMTMLCVDGVVVPSKACAVDVAGRTQAPVVVVPSACPMSEYRYNDQSFMGGLCSQGGHVSPNEIIPGHPEHWRDYTRLFTDMRGKRQVYAYSPMFVMDGKSPIDLHYNSLGVRMGNMRYDQLIGHIGQHSWNLVGNLSDAMVWQFALPNKFFDACAAGLPSVSFGTPMADEYIEGLGIGIVVKSVDELVARWDECIEKRKNLMLRRRELAMERFIPDLVEFYRNVLAA